MVVDVAAIIAAVLIILAVIAAVLVIFAVVATLPIFAVDTMLPVRVAVAIDDITVLLFTTAVAADAVPRPKPRGFLIDFGST